MTKPYSISFEKDMGIVKAIVSGKPSHEDHCTLRDEVIRLCQHNQCSKLLVDLSELNTERSSTVDCFSFGKSLPLLSPGLRIAHVLPIDAKSKEDVRFTSTVEANRGVICREFEDIVEAMKWILKQE